MRTLCCQPLNTSLGTFLLAASDHGLCRLHLPGEADWSGWFDRHFGGSASPGWNPALRRAMSQLEQFLAGERREFDLELDLRGTPFQIGVWNQLRSIPFGETRSYAQVAAGIGRPGSSRAVGTAAGRNSRSGRGSLPPGHRLQWTTGGLRRRSGPEAASAGVGRCRGSGSGLREVEVGTGRPCAPFVDRRLPTRGESPASTETVPAPAGQGAVRVHTGSMCPVTTRGPQIRRSPTCSAMRRPRGPGRPTRERRPQTGTGQSS